jgi:hypothetical protein
MASEHPGLNHPIARNEFSEAPAISRRYRLQGPDPDSKVVDANRK